MRLALLSIFLLLFIFGCAKEAVQEPEVTEEKPEVPEVETTGNEDVDSVGSAIADFDFETELDDSELDSLDGDLAGLDW